MATIRLLEESQAAGRVKEIFEEVKSTLQIPFVPDIFRAVAVKPPMLETVWNQVRGLFAAGSLDVRTKLLCALSVAAVQRSGYFVNIHSVALRRLGVSDAEIAELLETASLASALNTLVSGLDLSPEI